MIKYETIFSRLILNKQLLSFKYNFMQECIIMNYCPAEIMHQTLQKITAWKQLWQKLCVESSTHFLSIAEHKIVDIYRFRKQDMFWENKNPRRSSCQRHSRIDKKMEDMHKENENIISWNRNTNTQCKLCQ